MKQQGKTWRTADGQDTLSKYLPKHEILFERLGQRIATKAVDLEQELRNAKAMMIDACKEAMRNFPDKDAKTRFTFHTFDKEFRIEFDIKVENVRVYRATKNNPGSKDYELVNMDLNRSELVEGRIPFVSDAYVDETLARTADANLQLARTGSLEGGKFKQDETGQMPDAPQSVAPLRELNLSAKEIAAGVNHPSH